MHEIIMRPQKRHEIRTGMRWSQATHSSVTESVVHKFLLFPKVRSSQSTAAISITTLCHFSTVYTLRFWTVRASTSGMFPLDHARPRGTSSCPVTNKVFLHPRSSILLAKDLVLSPGQSRLSTTPNLSSLTFALRATRIPISMTFLGNLVLKSLGFGPNATPPPRRVGL